MIQFRFQSALALLATVLLAQCSSALDTTKFSVPGTTDLFIVDLPGGGCEAGEEVFKSYCEEHGGVLTTPLSETESNAIRQVEDEDFVCEYMKIAAYGAGGALPNALTFYTDDSQAQELTYANWDPDYPDNPTSKQCVFLYNDNDGFWYNEICNNSQGNNCGLCRASPCGTCGGDPHMKPFKAPSFSFHGQCDLVMMTSQSYDHEQGIELHIRTTRIDNGRQSYSYISGAALRIGTDVLELSDDGSLLLNGNEDEGEGIDTFAGHALTMTKRGKHDSIFVYDLQLSAGKSIEFRANTKTGLVFVDVKGIFPTDVAGLLGSPHHSKLFARDGKTDLTGAWNTFGEEWQVQGDDAKLFHDKNRSPQFPQGCIYEQTSGVKATSNLRQRRHLMELPMLTVDEAEAACVHATGDRKQFCVDDVLATGDVELANDSFYAK